MPAQKRSHDDDPIETDPRDRRENLQALSADEGDDDDVQDEDEDSDRSPSPERNGNKDEYLTLKLAEIRKEVQCPICLGIIKKTRTVMECLHRFCRECIDKSMRLGNNECPACRTHCPSRRSLRDDPNYDALIAAIYPDIDKYEEEELAFHEEEKTRNKQIQANIALTIRRQSEALSRKKSRSKAVATAASGRSPPGRVRNSRRRKRRRNHRDQAENQESSDEENDNEGSKADSSSGDEQAEQIPPKRSKRWGSGARPSQPLPSGPERGGGSVVDENDTLLAPLALVGSTERLSWGKGGIRSHNRHGSNNASNGKNARNNGRISKLVDFLRNSQPKNDHSAVGVNLVLVSINEETIPNLKQPYLCVGPTLTVKQLSEYIAGQTAMKPSEVGIVLAEPADGEIGPSAFSNLSILNSCVSSRGRLQGLRQDQTLADLKTHCFTCGYLLLAYQKTYSNPDSEIQKDDK